MVELVDVDAVEDMVEVEEPLEVFMVVETVSFLKKKFFFLQKNNVKKK